MSDSDSNVELFMHVPNLIYVPCFDVLKQNCGKSAKMCLSCFETKKHTCLMCINHFCIRCSVFENDDNVASGSLERRQFGGVLRVTFLRKNDKIITESLRNP